MSIVSKTVCDGCDAVADMTQRKHWYSIDLYTQEPNAHGEENERLDLCPECNVRWMDLQPQNWPRHT